jgi:cytochrome c-type biogenesis protein CcmH/NrfF
MKEIVTTLTVFDTWFAQHKTSCGVQRVKVSTERDDARVTVILSCPVCGNTIRGSLRESDWPEVVELLQQGRLSGGRDD